MNLKINYMCLLFVGLGRMNLSFAQTPSDGLMMPKGQICLAAVYENSNWFRYWEGDLLRNNENIRNFSRMLLMPMVVGGITDKVNFILSLPYIKTDASGGQMDGVQGIQDLSISLKVQFLNKIFPKGLLSAFTNLSFSTPASNYLSDYMPFSLGFGTNEVGIRAIGQYELEKGAYLRASLAFFHRGTTEAERDFYFNDGAFYTSKMNVPDAFHGQVFLGSWFLNKKLRVEAGLTTFRCATGDDIRVYNMPQPTNKIDFDRMEGFAQYYFNKSKTLGILAYYNHIFSGRNIGQSLGYGLGFTFQFKAL